jgi:anti-sigma regulatory factor (Ser/Thr protein kinase)/ActR/RegA family two-component response regulator
MGRVLLVEGDHDLSRALMDSHLLKEHEIETCAGNIEAVRRVRERVIDVVVTSPRTAVNEDLALTDELHLVRPGVRVIMLMPSASPDEVLSAVRRHVFACFSPPYDVAEIIDMMRSALAVTEWRDGIEVVSGLPYWITLRVSCRLLTADRVVRFMTELQNSVPSEERDLLIAAFREMLINAMEHGAGFDPEKVIEVTAAKTARAIVYHFRDPGAGFDHVDLQCACTSTSPDAAMETLRKRADLGLRPGGFGMLIVRHVVDELVYNERGNEVLLIKHLS